jgi:HEAT repeat protein
MISSLKLSTQPERVLLAIGVCGEIGGSESLDYLLRMLTHNSSEVRSAAKDAILKFDSPDCKKRLVDFIFDEIENSSRSQLLLGLCEKKSSETAEELMMCLHDRFWKIRCSAAQAVGFLKFMPAADKLKELTQDHNAAVRYYAKKALNNLGIPFKKWSVSAASDSSVLSPEKPVSPKPVKPAKPAALDKPGAAPKKDSVKPVEKPVEKPELHKEPSLKDLLLSKEDKVRMECLEKLSNEQIKEHFDIIESIIKGDPSEIIRSAAVKKIALCPGEKIANILNFALKDSDFRVRANAIESLEKTGGTEAIMVLTPLLMDSDNRIRTNAAKALHALGDEGIESKLVNLLKNGEPWMRDSAAYILCETGSQKVVAQLIDPLLNETEKDVSDKIFACINKYAGPSDLKLLHGLTENENFNFPEAALDCFKQLSERYPEAAEKFKPLENPHKTEQSVDEDEITLDLTDDLVLDQADGQDSEELTLDLTDEFAEFENNDQDTGQDEDEITLDLTDDLVLDQADGQGSEELTLDLTDEFAEFENNDQNLDFEDLDFKAGEDTPQIEPVPAGVIENEVIDLNGLDETEDIDFDSLDITPEDPDMLQTGDDLPPMALPKEQKKEESAKYNEEISLDFDSLELEDQNVSQNSAVSSSGGSEENSSDDFDSIDLDFDSLELDEPQTQEPGNKEVPAFDGPGLDSSVEIDDSMIDSLFADDLKEDSIVSQSPSKAKPAAPAEDDFSMDSDLDDLSKLLDDNL